VVDHQRPEDLRRGDAVGGRVVQRREDRRASAGEAVDDVDPPQRPVPRQLLLEDLGDDAAELGVGGPEPPR